MTTIVGALSLHPQHEAIVASALAGLANVALDAASEALAVAVGAPAELVAALRAHAGSGIVVARAAAAARNLGGQPAHRTALVDAGALPPLTRALADHARDGEGLVRVLGALRAIADCPQFPHAAAEALLPHAVVAVLRAHAGGDPAAAGGGAVGREALLLVGAMCAEAGPLREVLREEGAAGAVRAVALGGDAAVADAVLRALKETA